jgi:uncharacterized protein
MTAWYVANGDCITLILHVQPGAKKTAIAGLHGDALKVRLHAPPVEGRANEALLRFIADFFKVPLRNVQLKQGEQSRHKRVEVSGSQIKPDTLLA